MCRIYWLFNTFNKIMLFIHTHTRTQPVTSTLLHTQTNSCQSASDQIRKWNFSNEAFVGECYRMAFYFRYRLPFSQIIHIIMYRQWLRNEYDGLCIMCHSHSPFARVRLFWLPEVVFGVLSIVFSDVEQFVSPGRMGGLKENQALEHFTTNFQWLKNLGTIFHLLQQRNECFNKSGIRYDDINSCHVNVYINLY